MNRIGVLMAGMIVAGSLCGVPSRSVRITRASLRRHTGVCQILRCSQYAMVFDSTVAASFFSSLGMFKFGSFKNELARLVGVM
jgi:hypothetical protein